LNAKIFSKSNRFEEKTNHKDAPRKEESALDVSFVGGAGDPKAVHVVSAWVCENNLVPGRLSTEEKSKGNEVFKIT
jgi:hypothetical protein